jgi:hypothetical protein
MITLKISLGIFFLRIMVDRWQRYAVYFIVLVSTLAGLTLFFLTIFVCGVPVQAELYWQRKLEQRCASAATTLGVNYMHASVNSATDVSLALLPLTMMRKALIKKHEKRIVVAIFLVAVA